MKDVIGPIGSDVLRTWATLILPGSLAITPCFVLCCQQYPSFLSLVSSNAGETIAGFVAVSLFVGLILESLGSEIEVVWDKKDGVGSRWYRYLGKTFEHEPVGQRYIRTMVLRLKFELGTLVALLPSLVGVVLLWDTNPEHCGLFVSILLIGIAVGVYLFFSAKASHYVLHNARGAVLGDPQTPAAGNNNPIAGTS